jgi:hypothetical protein
VSSVGRVLLDRLQLDTIDAALTIVEQFMATMSDSSFLLITQVSAFPVCERILRLLPDVTVAQQFTPLWFFLLSMLHVILSIGSRHLTVQVLELAPDVPSIAAFIRAFASWTIEGKAIATLEFLGSLTPLEMSIEVLLLLNESGDGTPIIGLLPQFPFLWPSALTWAIAVSDARARPLLQQKPPDVRLLSKLFYQASVWVGYRPWLMFLSKPDFRFLRRFRPGSLTSIHFLLASDIGAVVHLVPVTAKLSTRIVFAWRAWVNGFRIMEFIRALLYVLVWKIQMCTNHSLEWTSFDAQPSSWSWPARARIAARE